MPLPKEERNDEMKKLASESVHVVSLQSRTSQALSQPAYRAALKAAEEEEQEEAKDITVRVMSSQSVLVTWSDSISEKQRPTPSRQYAVRYREKGESARWDYKQVPNKRVLVDKLIPDTMYEFAVRVSQGEKEGKWSASVYQRTPEAAPTSAPENLQVLPIKGKATSVTATWDALSESEGRVKEYILSYAPALKPFGAKSISYPGETTSAIVDDLEPGERYIFKIRAGNRRGQGPQSKAFSVVLPATSIPESKASRQTHTEDTLEIKASGNTEQSPSIQTSSVLSETISKHTSGHSSSVPHGRNTESSLSDLKKKLLSGSGILPKTQLSSRRRIEPETDSHSIESTSDHDSSSRTSMQSKIHDVKNHVTPHSPVKPSHSVPSSGRTAHRSRTLVRTGQISTDKQRLSPSSSSAHTSVSLSASSSPKDTGSEIQNARHGNANHHSSSEVTVDNLPDDNESNYQIDNTEKTSVKSSKTPGDSHLIFSSNQQPSPSQKVIHPTKLLTPSVSLKPSASSVSINSQKHSRYPSNKLVPSDTSGTPETYKSRETEQREQKPSSRLSSPRGGSSTAVQRKPLSHFSDHTLRDSRIATSAVSAAVTHTLPHSQGSSSAKKKHYGRDDSDDKSENSKKENEEHRQRSSSTSSSRLSSSQPASERFNLFKYRSALTANRFANKTGNTQNARIQPSAAPSSTLSSKLQPQSSSQLTSGSVHKFNANTDKHRELEGEDEHPLSTPHHGHSSSFSRQSSSVDYSRRKSSLTELRNPHIIAPIEKSNPTNVKEESFGEERKHTDTKMYSLHKDSLSSVSGQSQSLSRINHRSSTSQRLTNGQSSRSKGSTSSTDSLSRTSIEKPTPLLPSMYQPGDLDTKDDISPKSVQTPLLSKKTLVRNSHALSRKTLHPEPSHYQKVVTDQSRHQPSLNSRSHLRITSFQNKEKLEDEESESLGENYYEGAHDKEEQRAFPSIPIRDVSSSRRISTSLSQGNMDTFLLKHSDTHTRKSGERSPNQQESLTSSRGLSSSPGKPVGSQVISSSEDTSGASKLLVTSHQSKYVQPGSTSVGALAKDHQYSRGTSKSSSTNLRQTHFITPHSQSGFKVPTRTASQIEKKHGLFQPTPTKVELYPKTTNSKIHQSLSNNNGNYEDYDESETEENPTSYSVTRWSPSISRNSKGVKNDVASDKSKSPNPTLPHKGRFSDEKEYKQKEEVEEEPPTSKIPNSAPLGRSTSLTSRSSQSPNKSNTSPKLNLALPWSSGSSSVPSQRHPTHSVSPTHSSSSHIVSTSHRKQHSRLLNPSQQQQARVPHRQGVVADQP
uniref:Uncharacterized protein n=1 Tax=Sphaerodactylus townsendi TaxID=933632 RepID=A0ACB8GCI9_9SAUR